MGQYFHHSLFALTFVCSGRGLCSHTNLYLYSLDIVLFNSRVTRLLLFGLYFVHRVLRVPTDLVPPRT